MISKAPVVIATFLIAMLQVAVGQEPRIPPPDRPVDIASDEGPRDRNTREANDSVRDLEGNTYRFEAISGRANDESAPIPCTRVVFTRAGETRETARAYEGLFHSLAAGSKGVYAIRSIVPPPGDGEPPVPVLSVVALSVARGKRLDADLPSIAITQAEVIDVLAGSPDMIFVLRDTSPLVSDEHVRMPNAPMPMSIRALMFDGTELVETSAGAR